MFSFVILSLVFLLFLFVSLELTRNDWGSPAVIVSAMFFLCSLAGAYNSYMHGMKLSDDAMLLISGGVATFVCTSLLCNMLFRGTQAKKRNDSRNVGLELIAIPRAAIVIGIVLAAVTLLLHVRDTLSTFSLLGSSDNWNESMNAYRTASAYGDGLEEGGVSGLSNALAKLLTPVSFVYLYVGINNILASGRSVRHLPFFIPALSYLCCELVTGVRLGVIRMVCAAIVVAWVLWNRKHHWTKQIRISAFLKVFVLFLCACGCFWFLAWVVGRNVQLGILDYICSYIGYSFFSFDLFIADPIANHGNLFGAETLVALYGFVGRLLGDESLIMSGNNEFRIWHGVDLGNVYTGFRAWYADFGVIGMIVICLICSILITLLYERGRIVQTRHCISFSLVCYSYFSTGLFALPLVSLLTQTALQVTSVFELILINIIILLIDKQVLFAAGQDRNGSSAVRSACANRRADVFRNNEINLSPRK